MKRMVYKQHVHIPGVFVQLMDANPHHLTYVYKDLNVSIRYHYYCY